MNSNEQLRDALDSKAQLLHALLRFLRIVRQRRNVLIGSIVVALLLGAVFCLTSPRIYQARASLLIIQRGVEEQTPSISPESNRQGNLATFERLFSSSAVLEGAIEKLATPESRIDLAPHPREEWVDILRRNLTAHGIRSTNIIEVAYRSSSPRTAEFVVDAVVDSYKEFIDQNHKTLAGEVYTVLEKQRTEVLDELNAKKRELLREKSELGDFALTESNQAMHPHIHNVIKLNEILMEVKQKRVRQEASLQAIEAAVSKGGDLRQHLATLQPVLGKELISNALGLGAQNSEILTNLEQKLVSDRAELTSIRNHYGSAHPRVVRLQQGIQQAEEYVANYNQTWSDRLGKLHGDHMGRLLISMVTEELAQTRAHEQGLKQQFDAAENNAIQLNGKIASVTMLQQDLKQLRNNYDNLGTQISKIDVSKSQSDVRVAVPTPTKAEDKPVSPRIGGTMVLSLMTGMLIGFGTIYILDILADRFQSPEEMREQLGAPVLAMVRQLAEDGEGIQSLQTHVSPSAVESEAFRTLRTAIAFSNEELLCVAVSSSEPGDGKTTVLSNLGVVSAQGGRRTLMIDADLRRPGLTRKLDKRGDEGLSEILQSDGEIGEACAQRIQQLGIDGVDVLPSGRRPADPTGLLGSERFTDLLRWAHTAYDQILIDSPPTLAASDAGVIGRLADGLILVVQPNKNNRRLVHRSVDELRAAGVNLIGFVANRIGQGGQGYYDSNYGYGYGYGYGYESDEADQDVEQAANIPVTGDDIGPKDAPHPSISIRRADQKGPTRKRDAA